MLSECVRSLRSTTLPQSACHQYPFHCPCNGGPPSPPFVGDDYFCMWHTHNRWNNMCSCWSWQHNLFFNRKPLWNGEGCIDINQCCSQIDHPYIVKHLPSSTTDDIDLRLCTGFNTLIADIAIELVELYVLNVPSDWTNSISRTHSEFFKNIKQYIACEEH